MENQLKNNEKFLNSILDKENGFSVPKKYFSALDEQVLANLIVNTISKKNAFSVPELYFDALDDKLIAAIKNPEKPVKIISLKQRFYKIAFAGIAASILLFIGLRLSNTTNSDISFEHLSKNDIENWILEHSSEITTDDIALLIPIENINASDFSFVQIDDKDIEDYIILNDNTAILNEIN